MIWVVSNCVQPFYESYLDFCPGEFGVQYKSLIRISGISTIQVQVDHRLFTVAASAPNMVSTE
jgi:hypothetical protein